MKRKHEPDDTVARNRQALLQAEDQRVVSSWLASSLKSKQTAHGQTSASTSVSIPEVEDEESFSADEEEEGLGFISPTINGNGLDRQNLSANDKLRRQLLGKNASRAGRGQNGARGNHAHGMTASKPMPQQLKKTQPADSDDDIEGRTRVTGKKSNRQSNNESTIIPGDIDSTESSGIRKSSSTKRPASYLDELLAKRNLKKSKASQQQSKKLKKTDDEDG